MAAEAAADVEQDACDIRAAPSMDFCSTEEMLSVFEEYYETMLISIYIYIYRYGPN